MTLREMMKEAKKIDYLIKRHSIKRDKLLADAAVLQADMDELHDRKVALAKSCMTEMGVQVSVRKPSVDRKAAVCSICVSKGLSGEGHTAARHHVLVVRGDLRMPGDT